MHSFNVVIIESYRLLLRLSSGVCPRQTLAITHPWLEAGVVDHTRQSEAQHIFRVDMSKPVFDRRHSLRFVTVSTRAVSLYKPEHHQVCVAKVYTCRFAKAFLFGSSSRSTSAALLPAVFSRRSASIFLSSALAVNVLQRRPHRNTLRKRRRLESGSYRARPFSRNEVDSISSMSVASVSEFSN
jgi:hypothetical protein